MILALALCILIISSAASPYLSLSWNTLIIPIPQEPALRPAFASPHPREVFPSRTEIPCRQRSAPLCSLQCPKLLAQCMAHSMLSIIFLFEETESLSWIPGWLMATLLLTRLPDTDSLFPAYGHVSRALGISYKLPGFPNAKWLWEPGLLL